MNSETDAGKSEPKDEKRKPYVLAARYRVERASIHAYAQLQDALFRLTTVDLSAFRFLYESAWHVAAIGEHQPDLSIQARLAHVLRHGEHVNLSDDIVKQLLIRRRQKLAPGFSWVEGHYQPGEPLW
jgi:hypothetical protein